MYSRDYESLLTYTINYNTLAIKKDMYKSIVIKGTGSYMMRHTWRGLWCVCGWQDVGMVIHESSVLSFLPFLVTFFAIPSLHALSFLNDFSKTIYSSMVQPTS